MIPGAITPDSIQDRLKSSKIPMIMGRERSQGVDHELQVMIDAVLEWGQVPVKVGFSFATKAFTALR